MSLWKAGAFGCSSAMVPMTCSPRHVVHPSAGENVVNNPDANLINDDIRPTSDAERHWSVFNMASLWVGMVVCVPTYTLAGGLVAEGMSAWQAIFTITLGNAIVLVPMVLNGHPGTKYGIPFPVLARASFGIHGAHIPSILRALVACGWFGINTWFGGVSIYHLSNVLTGGLLEGADLPFLGINAGEFSCFLLFWTIQVAVVYAGIESIRILETYAAPFLIAMGLALLAWAYVQAGGFGETFSRPSEFAVGGPKEGQFFSVFFPSLTAMVGFWATLSLNIPDFTRYAKSQRDQLLGQAIGLPLTMTLFAFIAVAVTGATFTIFGETIADPTKLLGRMGEESTGLMSGVTVVISLFVLAVATLSTNIAANLVSPANAFINVKPKLVGFQLGGYITAAIGLVILPWKLLENTGDYLFVWLVGYSALLGPIGGILIVDYFLLRKTEFDLEALYQARGKYFYSGGFNIIAVLALILGAAPNLPGFLHAAGVVGDGVVPVFFDTLYTYAWFIGFGIAGTFYWLASKVMKR
jgi:NCS1 family nucleobase:cation symporter-1